MVVFPTIPAYLFSVHPILYYIGLGLIRQNICIHGKNIDIFYVLVEMRLVDEKNRRCKFRGTNPLKGTNKIRMYFKLIPKRNMYVEIKENLTCTAYKVCVSTF